MISPGIVEVPELESFKINISILIDSDKTITTMSSSKKNIKKSRYRASSRTHRVQRLKAK